MELVGQCFCFAYGSVQIIISILWVGCSEIPQASIGQESRFTVNGKGAKMRFTLWPKRIQNARGFPMTRIRVEDIEGRVVWSETKH
jgi:hypothetical protein